MPRVLVIGLDCAPPALVFDRFRDAMPTLTALAARGIWGPLRSTIPPITVPAWTTMVTGRDPGELGLYGFRNRVAGSYALHTVTAADVDVPRLWDTLGEAGKRVSVCFVPPTWPPRRVPGEMVSCFLTPPGAAAFTWPASLGAELETRFGPYRADVAEPRRGDHARVIAEIRAATQQHFAIARHLWQTRRPDFLMMVEMGPDRLHHALWRQMQPGGPLEAAARDYYAELDAQVGELIGTAGDDTTVIVASDHGARDMTGGIRINEWLIEQGWLALRATPETPRPLTPEDVDWSRTRAWGEGGYHARVMLNLAGREPQGIVGPADAGGELTRLAAALRNMTGPDGVPLGNVVHRPAEIYRAVRGLPPDLIVALGDLAYRSLATIGTGEIFTTRDDASDDGCNHDWNGIFIAAGPHITTRGKISHATLEDITPMILSTFGIGDKEPGSLSLHQ